jgi:betaine-aldehyde dehydrogenase
MSGSGGLDVELAMPRQSGLFYGGEWHEPGKPDTVTVTSPATGQALKTIAVAGGGDVDAAVAAARVGFAQWRHVAPLERAKILRSMANIIREHSTELALLDAADGGNPVAEMGGDSLMAAGLIDFFAGLVTEMKGASIPMGPGSVNFTVREPRGVIARIAAFNHPFLFLASALAAPLAAGNAVILKPAEQAPLSGLRLAELVGHLVPPGVINVLNGRAEVGAALAAHKGINMVTLIGSVPTGRAVMRGAAETLKPVLLELGGKNALIAFPDADPRIVAAGMVDGMNYTWCGQSCGSVSRVFLHEAIYDAVLARVPERIGKYKPGLPTDPATTMGAIISRAQYERILRFIQDTKDAGARLVCGGGPPSDPHLAGGFFVEPTVFADVTPQMRIAREEIFGPVQAVLKWRDESEMLEQVNGLDYGLTCAIFTNDLVKAHATAAAVEAGYVWINTVSRHFLGAPFGGYKQSGIGRGEGIEELLSFTQEKNIHINLRTGLPS